MTPEQAKAELRASVRARRGDRVVPDGPLNGERLRDVLLAAPELAAAKTVAAYVAIGTEPPTQPLLAALHERGTHVLLPVLTADGDLDWGRYDGPESLVDAARGLREPAGPYAGRDAISGAAVVVVPALAVDATGTRLGRGAGAYDRALARATGWTVALVYEEDVVPTVPSEPHDVAVSAAATPSRLLRFR